MSCEKLSAADLSEAESDTSSIMGDSSSNFESSMKPPSPASREQLVKRIESLLQENRVLKVEVDTFKLRVKHLQEENRTLKQASVLIQAKAEQEEEFISNTLLKKIQELKKEKETLALNYEQEEECLTNDLSRKLVQLRQEKAELAATIQQEQESLVSKLMRKIKKLESETQGKQQHLEQLRREKVELENTLEQEQEALVNRLWKRMDKLENEKRNLQEKLDQPISAPPSPMDVNNGEAADSVALAKHISYLRNEVSKLKQQLRLSQVEQSSRMQQLSREEQQIRDENIRLQRKLQMEMERREQLCRHLSESESSLEMEDERHFNELTSAQAPFSGTGAPPIRSRTISSPVSYPVSIPVQGGRPMSPALGGLNVNVNLPSGSGVAYSPPSPLGGAGRCNMCGSLYSSQNSMALYSTTSPPPPSQGLAIGPQGPHSAPLARTRSGGGNSISGGERGSGENDNKFVRPFNPPHSQIGSAVSPQPPYRHGTSSNEVGKVAASPPASFQDESSRDSMSSN